MVPDQVRGPGPFLALGKRLTVDFRVWVSTAVTGTPATVRHIRNQGSLELSTSLHPTRVPPAHTDWLQPAGREVNSLGTVCLGKATAVKTPGFGTGHLGLRELSRRLLLGPEGVALLSYHRVQVNSLSHAETPNYQNSLNFPNVSNTAQKGLPEPAGRPNTHPTCLDSYCPDNMRCSERNQASTSAVRQSCAPSASAGAE